MSKKFVVALSRAQDDPDRATVAFTLANAAIGTDCETVVFLSSEGVHLAIDGAADGIAEPGFAPLRELIERFVASGGQLYTCLPCFKKRSLDESRLIPGATIVGGMKLVAFMADGVPSVSY